MPICLTGAGPLSYVPTPPAGASWAYYMHPAYTSTDAAGVTPCIAGDPIRGLKDAVSGVWVDAQSVLANRPILTAAGGGKFYALPDGVNDRLVITPPGLTGNCTVGSSINTSGTIAGGVQYVWFGDIPQWFFCYDPSTGLNWQFAAGGATVAQVRAFAGVQTGIHSRDKTGNVLTAYINGSSIGTGTCNTFDPTLLSLLGSTAPANFYTQPFYGIVGYSSALDATGCLALHNHLLSLQ